jgi:hypothetical protein
MSQPVHGYLRFCFELSALTEMWGLEPKLPVITDKSGTRTAEFGSGNNICRFPILRAPDDAAHYRIFTLEKSLCFCERRDRTVQGIGPNEQHRHLFLEVSFGPRTRLVNGSTRRVVLGPEKPILVRVMEREVRFVICGVIYAFDDQVTSFVECHSEKNSTLRVSNVPESCGCACKSPWFGRRANS